MIERIQEYRERLLAVLAKLDQMQGDAEWIQAEPVYEDVSVRAEELREGLVELQSLVEERLNQLAPSNNSGIRLVHSALPNEAACPVKR